MKKDRKPKTQYFVWSPKNGDNAGYWLCYDRLEDCIESDNKEVVEIYVANLKKLGKFKLGMVAVK